jgi:hypothetical protein
MFRPRGSNGHVVVFEDPIGGLLELLRENLPIVRNAVSRWLGFPHAE